MSVVASSDGGMYEAALEIARRQAKTMELIRQALEQGDDVTALKYARVLCGLVQAANVA
ncbi:MAG: hypothetical protein L0387_11120 [Acidobacteria bacterium]|nr:hypothetical protein [Acidobacteriota bacterium]